MRNLSISLSVSIALIASLTLAACGGPSGKDIAMAKQARYQGDKLAIFNAAKSATEAKYKLDKSDETTLGLQTKGKWYTPEGLVAPGSDENMREVPDRSIRMTLVVRVLPDGDKWIVNVEPSMLRYFAGRPNPDKLEPTDPSVPGWALGQVDQLQYEIYSALKPYEVKSPGGNIAPAPTPAPAPTAPPPGEPANGSAAPGASSVQ